MTRARTNASVAAAYYDNVDIAGFYRLCWGGADIHIGRYETGGETVAEASAATTRHLLDFAGVGPGDRVLDLACGYGGTLMQLAGRGCLPTGVDISTVCVAEARKAVGEAGPKNAVQVEIGDFHALESMDGVWDAAICQESIIHSDDRPQVLAEVFRVLRPGGVFAFSDILTAEGADIAKVEAAFQRLGATAGSTRRDYQEMAEKAGFEIVHAEERPGDIRTHYDKLADLLTRPVAGLDPGAASQIAASLAQWRTALAGRHITWACFVARKPE